MTLHSASGETFFGGRPLSLPERALSGFGIVPFGSIARIGGETAAAARGLAKQADDAPTGVGVRTADEVKNVKCGPEFQKKTPKELPCVLLALTGWIG